MNTLSAVCTRGGRQTRDTTRMIKKDFDCRALVFIPPSKHQTGHGYVFVFVFVFGSVLKRNSSRR